MQRRANPQNEGSYTNHAAGLLILNDELLSRLRKILLQHAIYNKPNLRKTCRGDALPPVHRIPKAHQYSAGAASAQSEAIGKSRAGHTSQIHLAVDAHGLPVVFEITGGEINECTAAPERIAQLPSAEVIVADKGYDGDNIRLLIERQCARPVIPRKRNSTKENSELDR